MKPERDQFQLFFYVNFKQVQHNIHNIDPF